MSEGDWREDDEAYGAGGDVPLADDGGIALDAFWERLDPIGG